MVLKTNQGENTFFFHRNLSPESNQTSFSPPSSFNVQIFAFYLYFQAQGVLKMDINFGDGLLQALQFV